MKLDEGNLRYSATDLAGFTACRHLTRLDMAVAHGLVKRPHHSTLGLEALAQRGIDHERRILDEFVASGWEIVDLSAGNDQATQATETVEALRRGADVIYQGTLLVGDQLGKPDFMVRAALLDGGEGYEVVDAKLARSAKALAVLQGTFYSRLLREILGIPPDRLHLALGNGERATFRVPASEAYERQADLMFREFTNAPPAFPPTDTYPDPTEHCASCRWSQSCDARRRSDDDLSLVAGITSRQRFALQAEGVTTRRKLAALVELPIIDGIGIASLDHVRAQAAIQVRGDDEGKTLWEFIDPDLMDDGSLTPNRGLLALPEPVEGDLFFDIEGARHFTEDGHEFGLQYLFGIVDTAELGADERPVYRAFWGFTRSDEKIAFEAVVDFIVERMASRPNAHVFHYNHYEPTSMDHLSELHVTREEVVGHLMGRFATREDEVDNLLRRDIFVDLYRAVHQGIRASVESYSIKKLEPLYDFERQVALADLNSMMNELELDIDAGRATKDSQAGEVVRGYNEDDCRSTLALRDWLEMRRADLAAQIGGALPRPVTPEMHEDKTDPEVAQLRASLMDGVPDHDGDRTAQHRAKALVADLLEYHRREDKPMWWRYFHLQDLTDRELLEETDALSGLQFIGYGDQIKKSFVFRYTFPPQEHGLREGDDVKDPRADENWTVNTIDDATGEVTFLRGPTKLDRPHPTAVIERASDYRKGSHREAIRDIARQLIDAGDGKWGRSAAVDVLLRRRPLVDADTEGPLRRDEDRDIVAAALRCAENLDSSYLPIQGPPGTGKTYVSARQVLHLVSAGKKIGITATSHAVICNVLKELDEQAVKTGTSVSVGQKPGKDPRHVHPGAKILKKPDAILGALADGTVNVVGATTWTWTNAAMRGAIDILFIDEAGQMCLADVLASSLSAQNLVLLGDPMQLSQPSKGAHPPGAGVSALTHILRDDPTMPADRGLFMEQTRRMHPTLTTFTSDTFYEGRLDGIEGLENQTILGEGIVSGSGVRVIDVEHEGNSNASDQEAAAVAQTVHDLLECQWRDRHGDVLPMTSTDILVVTPFNAQIREIEIALKTRGIENIAVGTVDKFQGRQAPAVIYSMASSSAEDAPRGVEFLFDLHRLDVATSRALCVAIVVCSPNLSRTFCRTPKQIELVNALCRLREAATS
jgi:predicted RecB family nuclease